MNDVEYRSCKGGSGYGMEWVCACVGSTGLRGDVRADTELLDAGGEILRYIPALLVSSSTFGSTYIHGNEFQHTILSQHTDDHFAIRLSILVNQG